MRVWICLAILLLIAPAARADRFDDCEQSSDWQRKIRGCSAIISDPKEDGDEVLGAHNRRGIAYRQTGQFRKALEDFEMVINRSPKSDGALYNRALVYLQLREYERALQSFNAVIRTKPDDAIARRTRLLAFLGLKQPTKVLEECEELFRVLPFDAPLHYIRGLAKQMTNDNVAANKDIEAAKKMDPKGVEFIKSLGF